ncbi:hypothetical protein ACFC6U_01825 [Kitasatospora purpeofusca]|uniref:hypothetical protein n=1 Tax=Kitasatospora purpeofusca TaxID=67352 RepID=UPI0035D92250
MPALTERQIAALHAGAYLLPADPACPESFPVLAAAGFRVGFQVQDDGTVYVGIDAQDAEASLRTPDGKLRGIELDAPGCTRHVRTRGLRSWTRIWRRLLGRRATSPGPTRLHLMRDTALESLIAAAHSELHRRAVLAAAEHLAEVCRERGWPAPREMRSFSDEDGYDGTTSWSPNGVEILGVDHSRRTVDFGRRELGESFATEMIRAFLSEASEHQEPPQDAALVVTLLPSPAFHIDRY